MSNIIINSENRATRKDVISGGQYLKVSELFSHTIQGEGVYAGHPAVFLRLAGCVLNCSYCDSKEIWKHGRDYSYNALLTIFQNNGLIELFKKGHHLVITGGSPLLQQTRLIGFLQALLLRFEVDIFTEIENECVLEVHPDLQPLIKCWNNSPKLWNSENTTLETPIDAAITGAMQNPDSWFKFVITCEEDWNEIEVNYIITDLIPKEKIILMPMGMTQVELWLNAEIVVKIAVEHGVKYSSRLQIDLWDDKKGV